MLPPEAQSVIGTALAAAALPAGCAWDGARLDRDRIHTRYRCAAAPDALVVHELVVVHRSAAPEAARSRGAFAVASDGGADPALVEAVLRALEPHDPWQRPAAGAAASEAPAALSIHPGAWVFTALAALLFAAGLVLAKTAGRHARARDAPELVPLVTTAAAAASVAVIVSISTFRYVSDDFGYLVEARSHPLGLDTGQRILGVRLPFLLAERAGAHAWAVSAALDVAALVSLGASVAWLATRLGASRQGGWLAGLLVVASAPALDLARWGSGLQHLLSISMIAAAAAAFDTGFMREDRRGRIAWLALGAGLSTLAVITKWQVAFLAPASGLVLTYRSGALGRPAFFAAVLGAQLLALTTPGLEVPGEQLGGARLLENARELGWALMPLAGKGMLALASSALACAAAPNDLWGALAGPRARTARVAALALVFALPFLLNRLYFAEYYALFPWLWLALIAARALEASFRPRSWRRWPLAILIAIVIAPWNVARVPWSSAPSDDVGRWLDEAESALEQGAPIRSLRLAARCADREATRRSQERLQEYLELTEQGMGLRLRLGLDRYVPIGLHEGQTTLVYCEDQRPRLTRE
ncbi:MAG: hypothetical protein IT378_03570 [Sandaracinaceae bacterium]|nr:hypothetical protein [Sandaracinaceae bacterium]